MNKYWATLSGNEIAEEIMGKFEDYRDYMERSGIIRDLRKSYETFFGNPHIEDVDESIKAIHVNHYASYIRNIHNMVTASRPAWEAQAVNTDLESQADTQLAGGLLDYYMREKQIETKLTDACLQALYLKEGWISLGWNATGGQVYGVNPETGQPIHEGDFEVGIHTLLDICRDYRRRDMNHDWYIKRDYENRWDLAAKHPEFAEKIAGLEGDNRFDAEFELNGAQAAFADDTKDGDLIPTYTLFHARTDALKSGRMVKVLSSEIKLFDGPLPYKNIYLFPITTGKQTDTAFGHSYMMDLLPVQDAFDATVSAIVTNQSANAVQNFQVPKGAAPRVTALEGMNVWEYDPKAGKMEPMQLLNTAPEVFNFATFLLNQGDLISNVSAIGRGNAPTQMSGTAMALLQQQAIQSANGLQASFTIAIENIGTSMIELLQTFAVVPRIAMIAGKSKRSMMKEFSNKDLKGIGRVLVNRANPLMKANAGRLEVANQLLNAPQGFITDPQQYLGVLTTGNLEPLYQRDNSQRMNILSENELLMEGKPVQALLTDNHPTHILEHSCVLDSPEARQNPQVIKAVTAHIQEHMNIAKAMDPALAAVLKQQSLFQPPPPPMPTGGPGDMAPMMPPDQNPMADQVNMPMPAQPPNPDAFNQGVQ